MMNWLCRLTILTSGPSGSHSKAAYAWPTEMSYGSSGVPVPGLGNLEDLMPCLRTAEIYKIKDGKVIIVISIFHQLRGQ